MHTHRQDHGAPLSALGTVSSKAWPPAARGVAALLRSCQLLLSERGQANLYQHAQGVVAEYHALKPALRAAFFQALLRQLGPSASAVTQAAKAWLEAPSPQRLAELARVTEAPRQELLRRINRADGGTATVLSMRVALHEAMRTEPELAAVDADFLHLLSSWFNPGFLHFEPVGWSSSAALLEQLIRHEAVHAIAGWDDLRRRLEADRRCYAFFHPQLPGEPLIFVEVALVDDMPGAIAPLIAAQRDAKAPLSTRIAVFYSISNCQPGLRGVSLGNFLIKKVAEQLRRELPQIEVFCTLSPMPGFTRWLSRVQLGKLPGPVQAALVRVQAWRQAHETPSPADIAGVGRGLASDLRRLAAHYLIEASHGPLADPVARFHLDNGARLERIHVGADLSANGLRQSLSLMVNYRYDLGAVESRHQAFMDNKVSHAPALRRWLSGVAAPSPSQNTP